jgi:hypothetical protein
MRLSVSRIRRKIPPEREGRQSMAASRFKLDTATVQTDTRAGFGRGSAVREYWLERCHGFSAVGTDGRPLGRVKRVDVRIEGTFLRLTGIRAREVPVAAIETVWPSASVLTISAEGAGAGSTKPVGKELHSERPAWEDETLPWWELFTDGVHSSRSSTAPNAGWRLFSIVASARSPLKRTANACASWIRRLIERSRTLMKALGIEAVRFSVRTSQSARSAAARASRGLAKTSLRARRKLARAMFNLAVWIAGSKETILRSDPQDGSSGFDEEDTAEIP